MSPRLRTAEELDRLRRRREEVAFADAWKVLLQRADSAIDAGLRPAREGAGWGHGYYCPEHVEVLEFDPERPDRHRCPVDGADHIGAAYDAGWRCILNGRILDGVSAGAVVWQATGERRYRDHVVRILREYTRIYPDLPQNGIHVGKGRVTGQSLEEAVWGIGIARAYDDVRDSLQDADRRPIEDLLRQIGRQVHRQLLNKIHNIECWHLSSLATIGVVLDDAEFRAIATTGENALPAQLREGILDDGWWAEGSPSYHFYMAASVLHAALALRRSDPALLDRLGFHTMFAAPLTMLRPDLSLPAFNDGWVSIALPLGLAAYAGLYEQAWGLWQDAADADLLRDLYGRGVARNTEAALTMGPDLDRVEPGPPRVLRTVHPASGYAVLSDADRFLLVKYGPHGGGHGHPDKLQLDLSAFGVRTAPDAGSPAYNSPLQGPWFRQTLSHNTVLLGEESQPEAEGRLLRYVDPATSPVGLVDVEVGWPIDAGEQGRPGSWLREPRRRHVPAYAGATLRRIVLWKPGPDSYFLDVVLVDAAQDVPVDLMWHHRGVLVEPATLRTAEWAAPAEAYGFLDDVADLPGPTWQAAWKVDGAGTRMWGRDPDDGRTLIATSPSNPPAERQSTLLRRSRGRVCYATVIEPVRAGGGAIRSVRWGRASLDGAEVTVVHDSGVDGWQLGDTVGPVPMGEVAAVPTRDGAMLYRCSLAVPPHVAPHLSEQRPGRPDADG
ncbi:MAG TPA: heparinase II/III family protein [Mycobacteriales bacterium]|nr:heparinase II/III family protein [Mycobacteriales bacterium]